MRMRCRIATTTWPIGDAARNALAHHLAGRTHSPHDLVDGNVGVHVGIVQRRVDQEQPFIMS